MFCAMAPRPEATPSWDRLFDFAVGQEGLFTTQQAAERGLLAAAPRAVPDERTCASRRRGIYRLVHFPAGEHEDS